MRKLIALLTGAASVGGCAIAPGYGEAQPYYDSVYDYPFYGPGYGICSAWGDCGGWGGWYGWYGYHGYGNGWHGGWHGGHGGGHGGGGEHGGGR
jgi:hypothetical protein